MKSPEYDKQEPRPIHPWLLPTFCTITLLSGSLIVIIQKFMNRQHVSICSGPASLCPTQAFAAPMWQSVVMFAGQSPALLVYKIDAWLVRRKGGVQGHMEFPSSSKSMLKPRIPVHYWFVPACLDYIAATLTNIAFVITFVSTVQLLRNSNVVMCAVLQMFYLHRPLMVHSWIGIAIITIGMIVTGIYGIITADPSASIDPVYSWFGVVCAILGTGFMSFQMIYEEALMRKFYASPVAAIGYEGLYGFGIGIVGLVLFHILGLEDFQLTKHQILHSRELINLNVAYFVLVGVFNAVGMSVTKMTGAVLKAILYALRSALVYLLELGLGWNFFSWTNLTGLLLVCLGYSMYTNIAKTFCAPTSSYQNFVTKEVTWRTTPKSAGAETSSPSGGTDDAIGRTETP